MYRKPSKTFLPNHRLYDPKKESQREDYYYTLLLLFVPFRKEAELVNKGEAPEQVFSHACSATDSGTYLHNKKLKKILKAQEKVKLSTMLTWKRKRALPAVTSTLT